MTALMLAAQHNVYQVLPYLQKEVRMRNSDEQTALIIAAAKNYSLFV